MQRHRMRLSGRQFVLLCGVLPAILTAALAIVRPAFLAQLDWRLYDSMLRATAADPAGAAVAIVGIDERSLAAIGQWPWRRERIADLVTRVRDQGAAVVALDLLLAEPDRHDLATATSGPNPSDATLAAAFSGGRVVLGYAMTFAGTSHQSAGCVTHPLPLPTVSPAGDAPFRLARAQGLICSLPVLSEAASASGFLNAAPDADGILRRVPLLIEHENRIHPGLALSAVLTATGARPIAFRRSAGDASALVLDDRIVRLDGSGNLLVRFSTANPAFPYVSAVDVLQGRGPGASLKDAVVFVGATALGTGDEVSTAVARTHGVEVQASVADNLLRRISIARPENAMLLELIAVLVVGIAIALLVTRAGLTAAALAGGLALAGLWAGAHWLLSRGVYVSPFFPMGGLMASLGMATVAKLWQERVRANRADDEKEVAHRLMVQSLLSLTEIRDAETGSHSRRTQTYSRVLAEQLSEHPRFRAYLTPERIALLASLAPLHDIGKVGVPDQLLNKPGKLTAEEFREMKKHPALGLDVITRAQRRVGAGDDVILEMAKEIVYTHHERWDGGGYPRGLKGEQIPIAGRLIALVDVYDALTTTRRYRQPLSHDHAVRLIVDGNGTHFDPAVVDAFLRTEPLLRTVSADGDRAMVLNRAAIS